MVRPPAPGDQDITSRDQHVRAQDFEPDEVIIHPEYNKPGKFQNDIALIKLDRDIEINGLKVFSI